MDNRTININITQSGKVPNSVENQTTPTDVSNKGGLFQTLNELPIKQMALTLGVKKIAYGVAQRVGAYTGNAVLQRQIDNTLSVVQNGSAILIGAIVNPVVGASIAIGQAIDVAFQQADYNFNRNNENISAKQQQIVSNTNLNNNRYSGGRR